MSTTDFDNHIGMLHVDGREVRFALEKSSLDGPVTRATAVPEAAIDLTQSYDEMS